MTTLQLDRPLGEADLEEAGARDERCRDELLDGELLASTRRRDLTRKREAYQRLGCEHYWVVDTNLPAIGAWRRTEDGFELAAEATARKPVDVHEAFPFQLDPVVDRA